MDNQTRRILLERVKASGFPGSILDVFQNPAILDQFIAEQQQSQLQQPQNIQVVAETPEQQRQGLRPYHNNNITNVEMAFPNVEANQSINTIGMKGNLDVDVIKQGNLVQSFKAIPPGIANFPTGSPEGATLIESPAKGYQTGGPEKKKSMMSAEELPEDVFPYKGTSAMFKDERYNIDRARELYTEDESGHLPSIDYETGEWLKAKRYPTSWKEFNQYALNPEVNKLGFPTENEKGYLKYPNYQMGGSYQTNQEISMYEWRTGRPEESRKRYIKGGLKNRVLYNKARYKR